MSIHFMSPAIQICKWHILNMGLYYFIFINRFSFEKCVALPIKIMNSIIVSSYTCIVIFCFQVLFSRLQMLLLVLLVRPAFCLITYIMHYHLLYCPPSLKSLILSSHGRVSRSVTYTLTHVSKHTHNFRIRFYVWMETYTIIFFFSPMCLFLS